MLGLVRRCSQLAGGVVQDSSLDLLGKRYEISPITNLVPGIISKLDRQLHRKPHHPLSILRSKIEESFNRRYVRPEDGRPIFTLFSNLSPVVTVQQNFDDLLIPLDHPGRKPTDTYYINDDYVLRTHTTAHEVDLIRKGYRAFLTSGDVYRRDEIDATHYPVFHQMEGVRLFPVCSISMDNHSSEAITLIEQDMKQSLSYLVEDLFGQVRYRWIDTYFPFTQPSWELEIFFQDRWLEVLGCGILHPGVMRKAQNSEDVGWAFGLGLDRLAMVLFEIPDIRLFWSEDDRFLSQFRENDTELRKFVPFSRFPPCYKDMSFWINSSFDERDFYETIRGIASDLVESVQKVRRHFGFISSLPYIQVMQRRVHAEDIY
jgi:phenylalanyl-tRNA synthetase alpha chain